MYPGAGRSRNSEPPPSDSDRSDRRNCNPPLIAHIQKLGAHAERLQYEHFTRAFSHILQYASLRCAWRTRSHPALATDACEVGRMDGGGAWGLSGATATWGRDSAVNGTFTLTVDAHRAESRFRL